MISIAGLSWSVEVLHEILNFNGLNMKLFLFESQMPMPPWLEILKSGPFWGIIFAHVTHSFIYTTIGTFLPLYMNDVLQFSIAAVCIIREQVYIIY